mgnify:CR=1 FL=1
MRSFDAMQTSDCLGLAIHVLACIIERSQSVILAESELSLSVGHFPLRRGKTIYATWKGQAWIALHLLPLSRRPLLRG